jgi:catechol 2,3-dioxygenase-like lactoylglutathione lyase family enzyme
VLDHLCLQVTDVAASRAFYEALLAPLGLRVTYAEEVGACVDEERVLLYEAGGSDGGVLAAVYPVGVHGVECGPGGTFDAEDGDVGKPGSAHFVPEFIRRVPVATHEPEVAVVIPGGDPSATWERDPR